MKFNMFKLTAILAAFAFVLASCAKGAGENTNTPQAPVLDEAKLLAVAQGQKIVNQFGQELKESKQGNTRATGTTPPPLPSFSVLLAQRDPKQTKTDINSKTAKMQNRMKSANCGVSYKLDPKSSSSASSLQFYSIEVSGANCPFKLKQTVAGSISADAQSGNSATNADIKMTLNLEFEVLDQAIATEIDVKRINMQGDIAISARMNQSAADSMKFDGVINTQGESISLGAYSIETVVRLDAGLNSGNGQSAMTRLLFELAHKMVVGAEVGTIYGKVESADGNMNTAKQLWQVNGQNVDIEKFNEVASLMTIPGLGTLGGSKTSSLPGTKR